MMNTIMEEKIKQAFQEWKQTEQPKEKIMDEELSTNRKLSNVLMDKIKDNPGITGKELRAYVTQGFPDTPVSYVPALLKGFYDGNFVSRVAVPPSEGSMGRSTFAYTFVPEAERVKTSKKARKVKAKAKAKPVRKEDKGITTLIPVERKATRPLEVGPTTLHITISTSLGAYSMKLEEAKFIYQQLNQIFGGVR